MIDDFSPSSKNSAGSYGWSNAKNWSGAIPGQNDSVIVTGTGYVSLIDLSLTINAVAAAAGVTLVEAASQSLIAAGGITLAATADLAIGTNAFVGAGTLTGGGNEMITVGGGAVLSVANGMTFGSGTSFTIAASSGLGYVQSSLLTLGSSSTLSVDNRLWLQNGLTLGDNSQLSLSGMTAELKVDHASLGAADSVRLDAGTVTIANALSLGNGDTVAVASGVTFGAGSVSLGSNAVLDIESGTGLSASAIGKITGLGAGASVVVEGALQVGDAAGGSYTVRNGGALDVTGNLGGTSAISLAGGTVRLDGSVKLASGTGFAFSGPAGSTLSVASLNNFTQNGGSYGFGWTITGFDYGDVLQFPAFAFGWDSASYNSASHSIILRDLFGNTVLTVGNVFLAADVTTTGFRLGYDSITLTCFLSGTEIETETGPRPVETLQVGDGIVTIEAGTRVIRRACWIGTRAVDLDRIANGDALRPVRIRAGAFADTVPMRDLLVTPDHCILVDGGLIPARMLVNGGSIVSDHSLRRFSVHHVEFDRHAILLAEGLATESYLDTGNRDSFASPNDDASRQPLHWSDAAAPLTIDRQAVEPIWRRLAARAVRLGQAGCVARIAGTSDARLRVRLQDGTLLHATRRDARRHFFVLPAGTCQIAILSRSFVPALVEGPFVDDRRRLGVAVSAAALWNGLRTESLVIDASLPGWHAGEDGAGAVWTDGAGLLATGTLTRPTMLELTVTLAGTYLLDQPVDQPDTRHRAA